MTMQPQPARRSKPIQVPLRGFDLLTCFDNVLSYAFQPIVDSRARRTKSFEALVRSVGEEDPVAIFEAVPTQHLRSFDHRCRVEALALAARLGLTCDLNLNVDPRSFDRSGPAMMAALAEAAEACAFSLDRVVLEITEGDLLENHTRFRKLMDRYRSLGMKVAIDDFGAGYSGLNLLADFQPDQLKLDRHLVSNIESDGPRQAIARAIIQICGDLGIDLVAEGIETHSTYRWFRREGVFLFQGYLFAHPGLAMLPEPCFPPEA